MTDAVLVGMSTILYGPKTGYAVRYGDSWYLQYLDNEYAYWFEILGEAGE